MQGLIAVHVEAGELPLPRAVVDASGSLQLHCETHRFGIQVHDVARGGAIESDVERGQLAFAIGEIARVQVNLRAPRCACVEINLRVNAVQGHAVVVQPFAVRAESERRHTAGSAERAVRMQLATAFGGKQTHVRRIQREFQGKLVTELAVESDICLPETYAHGRELPGLAALGKLAAATRGKSAQSAGNIPKLNTEIAVAREALALRVESEIQLAGEVGAQSARIDAGGSACDRPALSRRPDHFAGNIRLAVEGRHVRAAHDESVLRKLRFYLQAHGCEFAHRDDRAAAQIVGPLAGKS